MPNASAFPLLQLPDNCLEAVLRCCSNDQRSLFSAARAHSRLHLTAVSVLQSIKAVRAQQRHVNSVLRYLKKHGQQLDSVSISGSLGCIVKLPLPPSVQLDSLQLSGVSLQVAWQGYGLLGVLGPAAGAATALRQLWLSDCKLHNRAAEQALAAAMWKLPEGLQHLSISNIRPRDFRFPVGVCQQLQQLTHLELADVEVVFPDGASRKLPGLQGMTRLVDVRLVDVSRVEVGDMLSGMQHLTHLELLPCWSLEVSVFDGKIQLQHLALYDMGMSAEQVAQLLSHLQHMRQLTHLSLDTALDSHDEGSPPAAAYAALTASSKLALLNICACRVPAGAWQHILPTGKQLPHLTEFDLAHLEQPSGDEGKGYPQQAAALSAAAQTCRSWTCRACSTVQSC